MSDWRSKLWHHIYDCNYTWNSATEICVTEIGASKVCTVDASAINVCAVNASAVYASVIDDSTTDKSHSIVSATSIIAPTVVPETLV